MIFSGAEIVTELTQLGISHVVWVPDSDLGEWEADLESSPIELLKFRRIQLQPKATIISGTTFRPGLER